MGTMKPLTAETAQALCRRLTLAAPGLPAVHAELRLDAGRHSVTFCGGIWGSHWLTMTVSTRERIIAHWRGYASQNGYSEAQIVATIKVPAPGDRIAFHQGIDRVGRVTKVGPRRVHAEFRYVKSHRPGRAWFEIDQVKPHPGIGWSGVIGQKTSR